MKQQTLDWNALDDEIDRLPPGAPRMSALLDAIAQADEAQVYRWSLLFRYRYACEATFHDDPPKGMPMAAEFGSIFEAHPEALPGGGDIYLMVMELAVDPIAALPQIPLSQWEELMEQFYTLVQRYQLGLRTYWWQMCYFWQYIDKERALTYFQRFWNTERDDLSDCPACEYSYAVRMALLAGDRKLADEYARPMEEGRIDFCADTPHRYWLAYLEDALDRGVPEEAASLADRLYQKGNRDKSDLSYLGAVLRCWAFTAPDRAVALVERRLNWTIGMWDQKKVYDFYKGAWVCFHELGKGLETMRLELPQAFPLYRADGAYQVRALAEWFHTQAAEIASRFDRRNGSHTFAQNLALAGGPDWEGAIR